VTTNPEFTGYRRLVADLLAAAAVQTPPRPALPRESREQVAAVVGQLLIRDDLLDCYLAELEPELQDKTELTTAVRAGREEFPVEDVVRDGLRVLPDEQLARLALDPIELENLRDYLSELLDTAACGDVWHDLTLGDTLEPAPYGEAASARPKPAGSQFFILQAHMLLGGSSSTAWTLRSCRGGRWPRLTGEASRQCFGTPHQELLITLYRQADSPGQWNVELVVMPAPRLAGLVITVSFHDGSRATFTIPPEDSSECSAFSAGSLPDAAFGTDRWPLVVRVNPVGGTEAH
jgi:hypothetical protein